MTRKTYEEIEHEIKALTAIKPHVRRMTFFNEDNHAAIDAQIEVLRKRMTADDLYDKYGDPASAMNDSGDEIDDDAPTFDQHALDSALEALNWMNGEGEPSPAAGWVM